MTDERDKCCVCGKVLFIDGKRQTSLCYHLGLSRKQILPDGQYCDGSDSRVFICKSCLVSENNEVIMSALLKDHRRTERIERQREKDERGDFVPMENAEDEINFEEE